MDWERAKTYVLHAWAKRPRSLLEAWELLRDECLFQPWFQYVWWLTALVVVVFEVAVGNPGTSRSPYVFLVVIPCHCHVSLNLMELPQMNFF